MEGYVQGALQKDLHIDSTLKQLLCESVKDDFCQYLEQFT